VLGAVIIVAILAIFPVLFLMSMAPLAAILGTVLKDDGEVRNAGSELVELNR
jgi:hypothetical protein